MFRRPRLSVTLPAWDVVILAPFIGGIIEAIKEDRMRARLVIVALLLAPGLAAAAKPSDGHTGGFLPVGWHRGEHWATGAPPGQKPKPKEHWDTPVDKVPDWSKQPDWDEKEKMPRETTVPL